MDIGGKDCKEASETVKVIQLFVTHTNEKTNHVVLCGEDIYERQLRSTDPATTDKVDKRVGAVKPGV